MGVDPATSFIHCHTTTTNDQSDASQLADLLDQLTSTTEPVAKACLDGACDSAACIDGLLNRDIRPIIPPSGGP